MGRTRLVCRLALRDIRHRPGQMMLLLLVTTAALSVLALGLIMRGVTSRPYDQTRAATRGPDVVVSSAGFTGGRQAFTAGAFAGLSRAAGVTAHSGPYPVAWPVLRIHGLTARAMAEGRSQAPARVDQPRMIEGTWVRSGGVVVERAFANALGAGVGGRITLDGRPFRITGIAVTAAVPVFSQVCFYGGCSGPGGRPGSFDTGLVWLTQAAARSLGEPGDPLTYYLNLRLKDPAAAPASVAVVAGARMAEQEKRVGLLKAAGATPPLAAAWLAAPLLTSPGASLVGSPGAPSLTWTIGLLVTAAALAVVGVSTLVPAVRAARISTVAALGGAARPPRRRPRLTALSAWLPVPLLLGLRLTARQPRRALLSAASFAVTATTIVAVLIFHVTVSQQASRAGPWSGPADPGNARVSQVLLVVTIVMGILAAANVIVTTWATVLDTRRFSAIVRSLGATPGQALAGLYAAQLLPALAGALLGIPAGAALYGAVQHAGPQGSPPASWLIAMVAGVLAAVAVLTAIPLRIGTRRPIPEILRISP